MGLVTIELLLRIGGELWVNFLMIGLLRKYMSIMILQEYSFHLSK